MFLDHASGYHTAEGNDEGAYHTGGLNRDVEDNAFPEKREDDLEIEHVDHTSVGGDLERIAAANLKQGEEDPDQPESEMSLDRRAG